MSHPTDAAGRRPSVVVTVAAMRELCDATRARGGSVGLVPTMGWFHEGHLSLMRAARDRDDLVVTSVFVNPLQFGPAEDLDLYPRDLERDAALAGSVGVDVVFAPPVEEMYPTGPPATTVHVEGLTAELCGRARPTHFDGVTTVVTKLLSIVGPCRAYFGRKDHQQLAVVQRMAADLDLPAEIVGCPLVREADGLAMSSRNEYLDGPERVAATVLHRALCAAADALRAGERDPRGLAELVRATIDDEPLVAVEYVEVRDASDLTPIDVVDGEVVVAVAARVGATRLIDNLGVSVTERGVTVDLGTGAAPGGREQPCTAR
jgi:pantoate--beta-alanine ligase